MASMTVTFPSDNLKISGNLVLPDGNKPFPAVLFLHGGGRVLSGRFAPWQQSLAGYGFASLFFSFRGCEKSEGIFEDGTLENRLRDASSAYRFLLSDKLINPHALFIAGASMGGHVASKLATIFPETKGLLLYSAAAYGKPAENLPLNEKFTGEIRKTESWKNSPAFSALSRYPGKIHVVYGSLDRVIPIGVKEMYKKLSHNHYTEIDGATHTILIVKTVQEKRCRDELFRISGEFFLS